MRRFLNVETLETRKLLSADAAGFEPVDSGAAEDQAAACQSLARMDVDSDGHVNAADLLAVINALSAGPALRAGPMDASRFDVNEDGHLTARDALMLINHLHHVGSGTGVTDVGDCQTIEHLSFEIDMGIGVARRGAGPEVVFDVGGTFKAEITDTSMAFEDANLTVSYGDDDVTAPLVIARSIPATLPKSAAMGGLGHYKYNGGLVSGQNYAETWSATLDRNLLTVTVRGVWAGGDIREYIYTYTARKVD